MTTRDAQELLADHGYRSLADFSPITADEWEIVYQMEEEEGDEKEESPCRTQK